MSSHIRHSKASGIKDEGMKAVLINYNFTPSWLFDYPELDYLISDRSDSKEYLKDFDQSKIVYTENRGNVDYDKLSYLIERYDNLPDVFLWGKSNLFKYVDRAEFDEALKNPRYTPLLKHDHKTYSDHLGVVCYYNEFNMYCERNDSWYLTQHPAKYFKSFNEWAVEFGIPTPRYIPFNPGGNFILTKDVVHKYSRDIYQKMKDTMDWAQTPGEAQLAERSYLMLWQ